MFCRMRAMLPSLWAHRAKQATRVDARVAALRGELATAEEKLRRPYCSVEDGLTDPDEVLTAELAMLKADRIHARATLERIHVAEWAPAELAPELIARFGRLMRENLTGGEIPFRKA